MRQLPFTAYVLEVCHNLKVLVRLLAVLAIGFPTILSAQSPTIPFVFDGHNDLHGRFVRGKHMGPTSMVDLKRWTDGQSDIPKFIKGKVGGAIFTLGINDRANPKASIHESANHFRALARKYGHLQVVTNSADLMAAAKQKKTAALFGLEGGDQINGSLDVLRECYRAGIRAMTLTWMKSNQLGDSSTDAPRTGGLSVFGLEVVREMNRLGMIIDLSHTSEATALDAIRWTKAPVILSHSSAYTLSPNLRNASDNLLRAVAKNGGLVMVTFVPEFTTEANSRWYEAGDIAWAEFKKNRSTAKQKMAEWERKNPPPVVTLDDVVRQINYVKAVAGVKHVGLGCDFDGMDYRIRGLEDASKLPDLFRALARKGWTEQDLRLLAFENFIRIFRQVESMKS